MTLKCPKGSPTHHPTERLKKLVMELYASGVNQELIARCLDIHEDTLRKHYRQELDINKAMMIAKLGNNLYQDALNGDKQSREFWLKCQGRWSYYKPPEDNVEKQCALSKIIDD